MVTRRAGTIHTIMARCHSAFPSAAAVVLGSLLLAAAINTGVAAPVAPAPSSPAVMLIVGDRSNPAGLIRLLCEVASYEKMAAARYVAQADAARRRGEAPVVRIPMPSAEAAVALVRAVPGAGATATVETTAPRS
jgi:hypothetical protein